MSYYYNFGLLKTTSMNLPVIDDINDRFEHLYLIGLSGMGKSTVMENMAYYELSQGYSVIFIDPKGESAQKLYYHFKDDPKVRYVSIDNPIVINMFTNKKYTFDTMVSEFSQIIDNIVTATSPNPESTIRMKEITYQALGGLQPEDRNFPKLYDFLSFKDTRSGYSYTDFQFRKWWEDLFNHRKTDYKKRSEYEVTMSSISSRIHQAIRNVKTKAFIEGDNELDIENMIKNGESLIINVKSSDDFIKVLITNLVVGAVLSYMSEEKKIKPLFLYIDEFDLVASSQFATSLQLGRSSLVGFTLAHQNFSSARSEAHRKMMYGIIEAILSAVSNYLVFNTSPSVAKVMTDVFNLKISDFVDLDKYESRIRLGIKKMFITTKKPLLGSIPYNYTFPTIQHPVEFRINFLKDAWIMI